MKTLILISVAMSWVAMIAFAVVIPRRDRRPKLPSAWWWATAGVLLTWVIINSAVPDSTLGHSAKAAMLCIATGTLGLFRLRYRRYPRTA